MNFKILILYMASISTCFSQDSTLVIEPTDFDKTNGSVIISNNSHWIFKKGNHASWAEKGIDTSGWMKLNPQQIKTDLADESGKAEGWFRLGFKMDTTVQKKISAAPSE